MGFEVTIKQLTFLFVKVIRSATSIVEQVSESEGIYDALYMRLCNVLCTRRSMQIRFSRILEVGASLSRRCPRSAFDMAGPVLPLGEALDDPTNTLANGISVLRLCIEPLALSLAKQQKRCMTGSPK